MRHSDPRTDVFGCHASKFGIELFIRTRPIGEHRWAALGEVRGLILCELLDTLPKPGEAVNDILICHLLRTCTADHEIKKFGLLFL